MDGWSVCGSGRRFPPVALIVGFARRLLVFGCCQWCRISGSVEGGVFVPDVGWYVEFDCDKI